MAFIWQQKQVIRDVFMFVFPRKKFSYLQMFTDKSN